MDALSLDAVVHMIPYGRNAKFRDVNHKLDRLLCQQHARSTAQQISTKESCKGLNIKKMPAITHCIRSSAARRASMAVASGRHTTMDRVVNYARYTLKSTNSGDKRGEVTRPQVQQLEICRVSAKYDLLY